MRARLIFLVQNRGAVVPFHHQHIIADVFKGLMRDNAEYKNYAYCNFSALKGQIRVVRDGLQYSSEKVTIVVASLSKEYLDTMIAKLFEQRSIKIGELIMVPESVDIEDEGVQESPLKFLCLSPIVICNPERSSDMECKRFVSPFADEFSDLIYESTMINMERSGLYSPEEFASFSKFQVVPDEGYLNKIKETVKKMARIYPAFEEDFMYEVRGYTLPFTLYAEPKVIDFVLNCGIGSLTKHGFGMLDIASNDFKKKSIRTVDTETTAPSPLLFQRVNVVE